MSTETALDEINDFLNGNLSNRVEPTQESESEPVAQEATAEADNEAQAASQAEQIAEVPQESTEVDDDKDYNFRRLREQNQEYKSKLEQLEQFKAEATQAFRQLYEQNQNMQKQFAAPQAVAADVDEASLSEVEKAIRRQVRAMNEPELKRLEALRQSEETRINALRSQELYSSALSTVDDIITLGKVNLGSNKDTFRNFVGDLVLNAAEKYNVDPKQARDALYNTLEMYHQAKKSQERAVTKSVVDQAKKVSSPITKTTVGSSDSATPAKIPPIDELKKQGYTGDIVDIVYKWQRDQLYKRQ